LHGYKSHGQLTFEPYFEQIFGSHKNFKKILEAFDSTDKKTNRIKAIILKEYDEFVRSNRAPFKLKDKRDKAFIDNIMLETGAITIEKDTGERTWLSDIE
jgi:uncharacterized HAD superfamily protein